MSMNKIIILLLCGAASDLASMGAVAEDLPPLNLQEARETALRNHPQITVAELKVLAAREVVKEARSSYLPNVSGNVVAVGTAGNNTRLAAVGALNNPSIFDRNAEGVIISQLITDFGRTANLTSSAKLRAESEANNAQATREQILLAVDAAFYGTLRAQSVSRVAQQTVTTRQSFLDQVSALASKKLRSELDVSFAKVNVEDANLLLSRAQNDLRASFAQLSTILGLRDPKSYQLLEPPLPPEVSTNVSNYVQQALNMRPDLLSVRQQHESALKFAKAERALRYPSISAVGSAGVVPVHDPALPDNYAAAGVIMNVPLFTGGLYSARQREAELRAEATAASIRDLENNVIRDVHIAWLNAQNAFDQNRITGRLRDNARESWNLAQARYQNGLSSIVELNQAELNLISAEIAFAGTRYDYLIQRSALNFQVGATPGG
jgi:outer membrane protein